MAVRVVAVNPPKEIEKECLCAACGATLRYMPADVRHYSGTDRSGGPDGAEWIVCANCSRIVVLRSW